MTTNNYEAAVLSLKEPESTNPYDAVVLDMAKRRKTQLRSSIAEAINTNPDEYARARRLSQQTGIPAEVVQRNFPEVEQKANFNKYVKLLEDTPELAEYLRSPEFAKLAADDLENLSVLQRTAKFFSRGAELAIVGTHDAAAGFYGVGQAVSEQLAADINRLPDGLLPANPAAQAAKFFSRKRQNAAAYADMRVGDLSDAGVIERGTVSAVRSLAGNLPLVAGAALTRSPRLALTGMAGITGGRSYGEGRDQGLSTNAAVVYGATDATIEFVTERLPVLRLLDDFAKNSGLTRTLTAQLAREIPGEQAATALQDLNAWSTLPENREKTFADYLAERPGAAAETLVSTIVAVGAQTTAVQSVDRVARRIGGQADQADAAAATAERLREIARKATASKLRERSPEQFKKFLDDAAPNSDLYVDPSTLTDTLAQSGIDPDDVPADIRERIGEAEDAGSDVRLTLGEFATHLADSAERLIPHLRTAPDAMTLSEAETFAQSGTETFDDDATAALEAEAQESERAAGTDSVRQAIRDQLDLIGRFNDSANELYATLTGSFYETMAARLGTTPAELYREMPLNIVAESPLAPAFSATDQRGSFQPDTNTIALLRNADLSTYIHESGHFFLQAMEGFAAREDVPAAITDDLNTLLKWFGVESLDAWHAMDLEARRESHEKFARGFEAYAFEGKAPSAELQPVFQRFRAWLVNVYKSLRKLNVELTPEVRQVFDRLLATDEQITEAQTLRDYTPIFESAEQAGMTPAEFAEYQDTGRQATDEAVENLQRRTLNDLRWLSNAKGRALKRLQKDAQEKRKAIRDEIKPGVEAEPIYRARRFIATGEIERDGEVVTVDDHKLSLDALNEMYPEGGIDFSQLTRGKRGVTKKGGIHPDALAELLGFRGGDQLVQALLITPPLADTVEALTDARMLEVHGDITDSAALERAAEAEIANETRAKFLARELAALRKSIGGWPTMVRGASMYARESILRKRIRDLQPFQYTVAERKASRAASQAFKAGDTSQAAVHKRSQLVANRLSKAAADARAEVEKDLRYLRRFNKESTRANIDIEYRDQIDSILERHDLRKSVSNTQLDKRASLLEFIEQQREMGFEPEIPTELLNEARRLHYRDMTVEQWRGMVDSLRNIEHLGKLKNKLLTAQDERRFNDAVDEATASIEEHATKVRKDKIESHLPLDRAGKLVRGLGAMHRKFASVVRQMDGSKDGGTLWELLVRPMNAAADREATMREEATIKLAKMFEGVNLRSKKLYIPEIDDALTLEARMAVALNWGTETNRARILDGDKWSPAQVQAVLDTLTEENWQLVRNVWDFVGSYWPQIEAKEKRVTGIAPEKVQGGTVETKFGAFEGAYWPIAYDPDRSTKSSADLNAEVKRQSMQGLYARASTRRGHTKRRVETVTRPVRKDFVGVLLGHVSQVVHDLSHHEFLIDANRLLRAPGIDGAVRDRYGPETVKLLSKALEDIAIGDIVAQTEFERVIGHLRAGVSVAYMGWSLSTAALQPLGLTQSIVRVGPKWIGRGVARWIGDASRMESTVKDIHERSEFMRLRGKTLMREINEIQNQVENRNSAIKASYFWFIGRMQMVSDVPTWLGAYEKATAEGNEDARAVALADQAVTDSQGSGSIGNLAAIQRGSPLLKVWTTFYSYFNTLYNLSAESVHRTKFTDPLSVGRLAVDFLMLYTVPATLGMLLHDAMRGGDDDEEFAERLTNENLAYLLSTVVGGRELSSAILGFRNRGTAGTRFWVSASDLISQAGQGDVDAALLKTLNETAGLVLHYPAKQVERTVTGINAVIEDDAPLSAVLFGPPRD